MQFSISFFLSLSLFVFHHHHVSLLVPLFHTYAHTYCNRNKKAGGAAAAAVETKKQARTKSPTKKKQAVSISFFFEEKTSEEEEGRKNRRSIGYIQFNVQKEERRSIVVKARKTCCYCCWDTEYTRWSSRILFSKKRRSDKR